MGPFMAAASIYQIYSLLGSDATKEEKLKGVARIFGGLGGGLLGAKMGGLLGLFGGPVGAIFGSLAGGISGYLLGDHLGDLLARYILGENLSINDVFPKGLGEFLTEKGSALANSISNSAAGFSDFETADARIAQAGQNLGVKDGNEQIVRGSVPKTGIFQGMNALTGKKGRLAFGELRPDIKQLIVDRVNNQVNRLGRTADQALLIKQNKIAQILTDIAEQLERNQQSGQGTVQIGTTIVGSTNNSVVVPMSSPKTQNETLSHLAGVH
jgi:hypothetical protein